MSKTRVYSLLRSNRSHFSLWTWTTPCYRTGSKLCPYIFLTQKIEKHTLAFVKMSDSTKMSTEENPTGLLTVDDKTETADRTVSSAANQGCLQPLLQQKRKKPVEIPQLRHITYREKLGKDLPAPGILNIEVVGSGGFGAPKSFLLCSEHDRYLFNCGEGTQRIANEHRMKLTRLKNIFVTHRSWENLGGLLGMTLTLAGAGVPKLTIHGPANIEKVYNQTRDFADGTSLLKVEKREIDTKSYEDYVLRIDYVPLYNSDNKTTSHLAHNGEEMPEAGENVSPTAADSMVDMSAEYHLQQAAKRARLTDPIDDAAVAFIITPKPAQRMMLMDKCKSLEIPNGPLLGMLKEGQDITLPDGTVIKPDDVLGEEEKCRPIIVVECPSPSYLDSLLKSDMLARCQSSVTDDPSKSTELVVHFTPSVVMKTDQYQLWMTRFPRDTRHLVLNDAADGGFSLEGVYKIQSLLSLMHGGIFPQLHIPTNDNKTANTTSEPHTPVLGATKMCYRYRPPHLKGFHREQVCQTVDTVNNEYIAEVMAQDGVPKLLEDTCAKLNEVSKNIAGGTGLYPEVVFLGTGSSQPSKTRNCTSILVHTDEKTCVLMDCGEGTLGQLCRHYGNDVYDVLRKISCVFVSHMHADHHLGLFSIVWARHKAIIAKQSWVPRLLLIAPRYMGAWLWFYSKEIEHIRHMIRFLPIQPMLDDDTRDDLNIAAILDRLNLAEITPVRVRHCNNAFGVVVRHKQGWKLVYSGDTMPCEQLVQAGKNCDLLIHEATMEDDLEEEAELKTHSTTSQAIDIGLRMKAKFIVLTHFSQRYSKVPLFNERFDDKVGIAFDNMRVRMCDLPLLPHFKSCLKAMFAEHYSYAESNTLKRKVADLSPEGRQKLFDEFVAQDAVAKS